MRIIIKTIYFSIPVREHLLRQSYLFFVYRFYNIMCNICNFICSRVCYITNCLTVTFFCCLFF